jgi:hypothetical protein
MLPSRHRNPIMIALAIVTIICFTISWFFFAIVAYTVIYGALIFSYIFVCDDKMRQATCPKGLWHTLIHDE